jgi:sugar transferase (PEP-CTERM system associated)
MPAFTVRSATLVACETLLILAAVMLAAWLRLGDWMWEILANQQGLLKMALVAAVTQTCLYYADLYDARLISDRRELFTRCMQALAAASFFLALLYFWFPVLIIGRGVFLIAAALVVAVVVGWRLAFIWISGYVRPRERLLLVGTGAAAVNLARELFERRHELGVEIVGFVDNDPQRVGAPVLNPGVIGVIDDIPRIVQETQADRVVVSLADARGKLPMDKLLDMRLDGVAFDHLAALYEEYTGKIALENLRPSWLIFSEGFRKSRPLSVLKRTIDIGVGLVGMAAGAPVMLLVAAAVWATSRGPVLYHQNRVGLNGRLFMVHKFRTMRVDAEAETGPVWAARHGDPRVTPVGRFLRRTRLDELPQLWNVLIGEMSLVGPRPERPEFVAKLSEQIPYYRQRHFVRPGLTGWAQVRYTYGASVEDALEKLQYDLFYIKNLSIPLDLFIILQTIKTVILHRGA